MSLEADFFKAIRSAMVSIEIDDTNTGGYKKTVNGVALSEDGLILTCAHIFVKSKIDGTEKKLQLDDFKMKPNEYSLSVTDVTGKTFSKAKLVAILLDRDLAVVDVGEKGLQPVKVAQLPPTKGEDVYFIGSRLENDSLGITTIRHLEKQAIVVDHTEAQLIAAALESIAPKTVVPKTIARRAIVANIAAGPGFSGSPLFNGKGELLSVTQGGFLEAEAGAERYGFSFTVFPSSSYVIEILKPYRHRIDKSSDFFLRARAPKINIASPAKKNTKIPPNSAPEMMPFNHENSLQLFLKNYEDALKSNPFYKDARVQKDPYEIILVLNEKTNSWPESNLNEILSQIAKSTWDGFVHGVTTGLENNELYLKGRVAIRREPKFEMVFEFERRP